MNWLLFSAAVLAGSVQLGLRRLATCQASQVVTPTTASALVLPTASAPRPVPAQTLVGTSASAPAGVAGRAASVPPKLGQCLMTAYTMPGTRTSRP